MPQPTQVLTQEDVELIEALYKRDLSPLDVQRLLPHVSKSALYRHRENYKQFGSIRKPASAQKTRGPRRAVTPEMQAWVRETIAKKPEVWQSELVLELYFKFGVKVSQSTMSKFLKRAELSKEKHPRKRKAAKNQSSCGSSSAITTDDV